ncbi:hypothetical protein J2853_003147 [Streptosporangium lutulentum]|uniref:Uncharacterized protein n=1 Tax=Streptosporangium lutulentum TaxID=1461250 RepID=A0ABT9QC52_9ACTN|nr:hypothetical protein [Streptosporangium lutulentum]
MILRLDVDMRKLIGKSNIINKRVIEQKKMKIAVYPTMCEEIKIVQR